MFPTIPENLSELDNDALAALRTELRDAVTALRESGDTSTEAMSNARAAKAAFDSIKAILAEREAAEAELAGIADDLSDEDEGTDESTEDEADDEDDDDLADNAEPDRKSVV